MTAPIPAPLPCPWCGRRPQLGSSPTMVRIYCRTSFCTVKPYTWRTTAARAVKAWNMRPYR